MLLATNEYKFQKLKPKAVFANHGPPLKDFARKGWAPMEMYSIEKTNKTICDKYQTTKTHI